MSEVKSDATAGHARVRKKKVRRTEETVEPKVKPVDIDQLRVEKFNEIQVDALKVRDPLQSAIKGAAGDLFFLCHKMKQVIVATLDESKGVSRFDKATPAIELFLKVSRQADRFAQIDQRILDTRSAQANRVPVGEGEPGI